MEEIASVVQIINVMFQGISLALKVGKDTVDMGKRVVKLMGNMIAAPVKGTKKAASWAKYHKETGSTNFKNVSVRAKGDLSFVKLNKSQFDKHLRRALKKAGVLYTAVPLFKGADKNTIHLAFASADLPRITAILEEYEKLYVKEEIKHGLSKEQAQKDFKTQNSVETMDEMMQEIGAKGSYEDFNKQIEAVFGKDYVADMVREEAVYGIGMGEKEGFSQIPGTVPVSEIDEKLNEIARVIKEQKKDDGIETIGISFVHNPKDPENSHIVGQTEDFVKVQLNEHGKACVMIPKECIRGNLEKEQPGGMFTARVPKNAELLIVDMDEKNPAIKMSVKDFSEKYGDWEKRLQKEREALARARRAKEKAKATMLDKRSAIGGKTPFNERKR